MLIEETTCCAVKEIDGLSEYTNAKDAMLDACEELGIYNYPKYTPGFVIFTGVVNRGQRYGQNFKAFILRNKLGSVAESPAAPNRINHPSHLVKVWVWQPDPTRLQHWYKQNRTED